MKIMLKRVPTKTNHSSQHEIMKQWSATMVEAHSQNCNIEIISVSDLTERHRVQNREVIKQIEKSSIK